MVATFGATVFTSTYPNQPGRVAASTQFDTYLGLPWALTAQKVYYAEGQWPQNINDINPVGNMAQAGIFILACVKPLRTMTNAEYNNLVNFIALLKANNVNFEITLWNEANGNGANGAFASGAAYTAYVNFYIPALRAAGVKHVYVPALFTPGTVTSWYPGDANVDKILPDYYFLDYLNKGATLDSILNLAANHSGGPCPVGLGEFGVVNGPKFPNIARFNFWLVTHVQVPFLTYVNQGGTLDKFMWYDAGAGANQINAQTPGSQLITMANVAAVLTNAQPVGAILQGPDYPDYQTPQATADAISNTGAPLLALSGSLLSSLEIGVKGGQSVPIPNLLINQLGYEIQISATIGNGSTIPFVVADMSWTDPTTGLAVAEEQWILPCADTGLSNTINGTGPTKAGQLTITFTNLDPAVEATVAVVLLTNSRIYARDRWIQTANNPANGYPVTGGRPFSGIIASWSNQTITAGNSSSVLLPLYAGDVSFYIDQVGIPATSIVAKLQAAPTSRFGTASFWSGSPAGGTGSGILQLLRLPKAPALLTINNNGAANATVNMKVIALDETH